MPSENLSTSQIFLTLRVSPSGDAFSEGSENMVTSHPFVSFSLLYSSYQKHYMVSSKNILI